MFDNQTAWLVRCAALSTGAVAVLRDGSLIAAVMPAGGSLILPVDADPAPAQLDAAFAWLREGRGVDLLVWSATPRPALDLPLASRGCQEGFRPLWMWRDLPLLDGGGSIPDDVDVSLATDDDRPAMAATRDVPNLDSGTLELILELAQTPAMAGAVRLLLARDRGTRSGVIVGGGAINLLAEGGTTIAGLYNLGVRRDRQGRGIGTALTRELCRIAADLGATAIALNATPSGEQVYRKLGFVETGRGQTWFLPADRLRSPPDRETVRRAEALGSGAVDALDPALARAERMPNGDTPLAFAARFGQPNAARWLVANGAEPEIPALWRVGLRDEAMAAMQDRRHLDARQGQDGTTPLHEAVRDDDAGLVRLLLGAGADLTARDARYGSTPLGWALALDRSHLVNVLEAAALEVDPDM